MFRDYNCAELFQLKDALQKITEFIFTCQKPLAKDTLLEKVIDKFTKSSQEKNAILDEITSDLNIPSLFGLDDWLEDEIHTKENVIECLQRLEKKIDKIDKENQQVDNLDDILNKLRERGFIFIPPDLLRSLWRLGKATNYYINTKENGKDIEQEGIEVMTRAAKWVKACSKRWREIEKDKLTSIRPDEDAPF